MWIALLIFIIFIIFAILGGILELIEYFVKNILPIILGGIILIIIVILCSS